MTDGGEAERRTASALNPDQGGRAVTLVVPCWNEAQRLRPEEFSRFAARHPGVRFVFVDDGSADATRGLLAALCRTTPDRFELIAWDDNRGQGEAVRAGVHLALRRGDDYVGYWDADLAAPLDEIPRFVELLDRSPVCLAVFGSRRRARDRAVRRHPARFVLGRLFAWVARAVLGMPVYDTQCGAKLFRRSPEVEAMFAQPFASRWIFDVELIARLIRCKGGAIAARAHLAELPLAAWRDVAGSKLRLQDFLRAPLELLQIARALHRPASLRPALGRGEEVLAEPLQTRPESVP